MFQLISILKSLAVTIVIVLLLQIKVGNDTLEDRAVFWFRSSPTVQPLQTVVNGGVKFVRNGFHKLTALFDWNPSKSLSNQPGKRDLNFQIERSRQYLRDQAEKVARKMEQETEVQKNQRSSE